MLFLLREINSNLRFSNDFLSNWASSDLKWIKVQLLQRRRSRLRKTKWPRRSSPSSWCGSCGSKSGCSFWTCLSCSFRRLAISYFPTLLAIFCLTCKSTTLTTSDTTSLSGSLSSLWAHCRLWPTESFPATSQKGWAIHWGKNFFPVSSTKTLPFTTSLEPATSVSSPHYLYSIQTVKRHSARAGRALDIRGYDSEVSLRLHRDDSRDVHLLLETYDLRHSAHFASHLVQQDFYELYDEV